MKMVMRMSPTRLVFAGLLFAFLAANLTLLARRTTVAPAGRSSGSDIPVVTATLNDIDPRKDASSSSSPVANIDDYSCLRARRDTIPKRLYGNLSLPYINLGFPKMGTSSIQSFFGCAGYRSRHYNCGGITCAKCALESSLAGEAPLNRCGTADVYSQIEGKVDGEDLYFPQIELLEEFVQKYPSATFLLTFRDMERWYESISNWPPPHPITKVRYVSLKDRIQRANVTGLPPGKGENLRQFTDFFCGHVRRVREAVPPQRLVEIDIEDPSLASYVADVFDLDEKCWGRANVNAALHPALNQTKGSGGVPPFIMGKVMLRGKNGTLRSRRNLPLLPPVKRAGTGDKIESVVGVEQSNDEMSVIDSKLNEKKEYRRSYTATSEANDADTGLAQRTLKSCRELTAHENGGYWHHSTRTENNDSPIMRETFALEMYYPEEMRWLGGQRLPPAGFGKCTMSNKFLMYNAMLGHQCGCGVRGFAPSHSVWVYNTTKQLPAPASDKSFSAEDYYARSPTLRLAKNLADANATLCFSGDSIDYQIYSAFYNNLRRVDQLYRQNHPGEEGIVGVVSREIPVRHSTKPGNADDWFLYGHRPPDGDGSFLHARRPPPGGHGSLFSILETKAFFNNAQSHGTRSSKARIRYYMSYGWSPWNVDFQEDCHVIVMNLGLHYHPDGNNTNKQTSHPLMDDMLAAITYLSNFTASKDKRVAVWRSALPQHFPTKDGHFHGWKKMRKDSCSVIDKVHSGKQQQTYNEVYDEAFSKLCQPKEHIDDAVMQSCDDHGHLCKVNPAAEVDYQTIYNFWRTNNCTEQMEREQLRLSTSNGTEEKHATGAIFRWNIFDLFDVTQWHAKDLDCSHFCYIPPLFEASFHRLELLLSPLLASW